MKNLILYMVFGCLIFISSGCAPYIPPDIQALLINSDDVPSGWEHNTFNVWNECDGKKYIWGYTYGNIDDFLAPDIGHSIIVYSDVEKAIKGYNECKALYILDFMFSPSEMKFIPSNPKDLYAFKCDDTLKINGKYRLDCYVLQQHNNFVSMVEVRMGEPFSYDVLNSILKAIDSKLNNRP